MKRRMEFASGREIIIAWRRSMVALAAVIFLTQSHADDVKYLTSQAKVYYHNVTGERPRSTASPGRRRLLDQTGFGGER